MTLLARVGALLLAAATAVVGGATVGIGTAAAYCMDDADYGCANNRKAVSATIENVDVEQSWSEGVLPGAPFEFRIRLQLTDENSSRSITKVTHHAPPGFVYASARMDTTRVDGPRLALDGTVTVGPTGAVTVEAPAGGWPIERNNSYNGVISVFVKYTVALPAAGTSGVTFAATDIPETGSPVATGTVDPLAALTTAGSAGTGSAGS